MKPFSRHALYRSKKTPVSTFGVINGIVLTVYVIGMMLLFLWALSTALKTTDNFDRDPLGWTRSWAWTNFGDVFMKMRVQVSGNDGGLHWVYLDQMFLYSLLYAGGAAFIQTLTTATMAYMTSTYKNWFSRILHTIVIITLILPIVGNTASFLQIMTDLHLYDHFYGIYIMKIGFNNIYYLIFYAAFSKIPKDYRESARIDGANLLQLYTRISFPMVSSLFWTVFLLLFIGYWNDYQTPLLFLPDKPTAALGLYYFLQSTDPAFANPPMKVAAGICVFIPIFIVFLIFRNRIMQDLNEGGIKG